MTSLSGSPAKMATFGWTRRLKYAGLAGVAAWIAGWAITFPFELSLARRYVDGNAAELPVSLAKGLVVWAGFSLFMAMAGFVPLVLPAFLLIPPRWIVRWRPILIPAAPLAAFVAINRRMGFLNRYYFLHPRPVERFFFTAPNFFALTFALVVVWVYAVLAGRRLASGPSVLAASSLATGSPR
jgi:hypothetical protein